MNMDAYDRFWQWADKSPQSFTTIPAVLHHAVMMLPRQDRRDRAKVNAALAAAER
jgi:hypothetical protein